MTIIKEILPKLPKPSMLISAFFFLRFIQFNPPQIFSRDLPVSYEGAAWNIGKFGADLAILRDPSFSSLHDVIFELDDVYVLLLLLLLLLPSNYLLIFRTHCACAFPVPLFVFVTHCEPAMGCFSRRLDY
jgi:hypothetical protein